MTSSKIPDIETEAQLDYIGVPITGWYCSVCFEYANVMMNGETLCRDHAKRWKFGYGEKLINMRKEKGK